MAERKKRMRSAMDALDEVKDKMSEDAYLMLFEAAKEQYARLTREEEQIAHPEEDEEDEEDEDEEDEAPTSLDLKAQIARRERRDATQR